MLFHSLCTHSAPQACLTFGEHKGHSRNLKTKPVEINGNWVKSHFFAQLQFTSMGSIYQWLPRVLTYFVLLEKVTTTPLPPIRCFLACTSRRQKPAPLGGLALQNTGALKGFPGGLENGQRDFFRFTVSSVSFRQLYSSCAPSVSTNTLFWDSRARFWTCKFSAIKAKWRWFFLKKDHTSGSFPPRSSQRHAKFSAGVTIWSSRWVCQQVIALDGGLWLLCQGNVTGSRAAQTS